MDTKGRGQGNKKQHRAERVNINGVLNPETKEIIVIESQQFPLQSNLGIDNRKEDSD